MKRRTFLKHAGHSLAVTGLMSSFGFTLPSQQRLVSMLREAAENNRVLVLIFLQGGNDGLNTVVPLDQFSRLTSVRPHVILPENKLHKLSGTSLGLHPSLDFFKSLYNEGKLEIIQSVGYPDQNYSHFRSTDIWMSGSASNQLVNSGWTGRYLYNEYPDYPVGYPNATDTDPLAVEIGYGASLLFQGSSASMSTVISDPNSFYQLVDNVEGPAPATPAGEKLKFVRLIARQSQQYGEVMKQAATSITQQQPFPDTSLAQQLKIVSRLIAGGLKTPLYMVKLGGFDTHDAQVLQNDHTKGEHADLLKELNDAVKAFMADLEFHGVSDNVVGMTFSEFGRRIVSNASLGTDHGSAAPLFVFGNKVRGGVLGNNPVIPQTVTYNDNLAMQFDFRQIYTSVLQQWLSVSEATASTVMMDDFETVPVIGPSVVTGIIKETAKTFQVFPNPINNFTTIQFESDGRLINLEAVDIFGRKADHIFSGTLPTGTQNVVWNSHNLAEGRYFVILKQGEQKLVKSIIKAY